MLTLIRIHTFLIFNVLKREVSNVFLYIWTINYSYSYSLKEFFFSDDIVALNKPAGISVHGERVCK